jgi:zinc transport system ATP-binding protein
MTGALVELRAAAIGYDDHEVLRDIDFTVSQGEFVAVVGPNGSGKSTLIKALVGLTPLTSGSLELFGLPAERFADKWRIGYVPQRHTVGGPLPATVREVVASGRLARAGLLHRGRPADRAAVDNAMERVGVAELARRPVDRLSGGQQRRVLIARALASETDLLVLDEPTAGVDGATQTSLAQTLGQLSLLGTTIMLVTHDLEPFTDNLTRVVWIRHGRVEYDGPPTAAIMSASSEPFTHHQHRPSTGEGPLAGDLGALG